MDELRVSFFQYDIAWEDKRKNLSQVEWALKLLEGSSDLLVLPEMFSTGFSMRSGELAEPVSGETIVALSQWSQQYGIAISGSFICSEGDCCYNRAFFLTPDGERFFYDKRHLFRMGGEQRFFSSGVHRLIVPYKGWNISLLICYDLRFPVWSRNIGNSYDLLFYCSNWPAARADVWTSLLKARAIENCAYVAGVNRVGCDGNGIGHSGHSAVYDYKGVLMNELSDKEQLLTTVLSLERLWQFREKFPAWEDADRFNIEL